MTELEISPISDFMQQYRSLQKQHIERDLMEC